MNRILRVIVVAFCLVMVLPTRTSFSENESHALAVSGQVPTQIGGSFMVSLICRDGIIVAADSRGNIEDEHHRRLAYYDGVQKVFALGNNAIAYTGTDFIQNLHFSALVREFSKVCPAHVDQILPAFLCFCDQLQEEARMQVRKQALIAAGYTDGKPSICYYNEAQTDGQKYACGHGLVSSDRTALDNYRTELLTMEYRKTVSLVKKAIKAYSQKHNNNTIGGPIYVRLLAPNESRWLGNAPPESHWTYLDEFAADYWKGKIRVTLLPGVRRSELDNIVAKGEAWSKQGRHLRENH